LNLYVYKSVKLDEFIIVQQVATIPDKNSNWICSIWSKDNYTLWYFLPSLHSFVSSMFTIQGLKFFLSFSQTPQLRKPWKHQTMAINCIVCNRP
jgi:hypothetical protein